MHFKSSNPLLMIIDLQKAIDHPSWGIRNNPDAEIQMQNLLNTWRELNLPLLHIKHMSINPSSKYFPGSEGNDFKDEVMPLASEQILKKESNSAFINTKLDETLQEKGISEIVIVGVITNNSVEATARMSGNLGYRTIVISDATFTFNKTDFSGLEHAAEVVHNLSLANMNNEYADIHSTKDVLSSLDCLKLKLK